MLKLLHTTPHLRISAPITMLDAGEDAAAMSRCQTPAPAMLTSDAGLSLPLFVVSVSTVSALLRLYLYLCCKINDLFFMYSIACKVLSALKPIKMKTIETI